VESGWPTSEVMQEHLQNLVSQGYMTVAELATCHVPKDPASLALAGRYVMACVEFYRRGFGVLSLPLWYKLSGAKPLILLF
jgi:hypothetical protein